MKKLGATGRFPRGKLDQSDEGELRLAVASALAILVSDDGDEDNAVWLPRSQIEYDRNAAVGDEITMTMPEWLAEDKGLI
jgi:hypothetical protein